MVVIRIGRFLVAPHSYIAILKRFSNNIDGRSIAHMIVLTSTLFRKTFSQQYFFFACVYELDRRPPRRQHIAVMPQIENALWSN